MHNQVCSGFTFQFDFGEGGSLISYPEVAIAPLGIAARATVLFLILSLPRELLGPHGFRGPLRYVAVV